MKIQVISDLHQEFGFMDLSFNGADLVLLAGDINLGTKGIEWIKSTITDVPVIYVLGNHEYYKGSYPKTLNAICSLASDSNVHVLENEAVVMGDVTFHGATLWTDFALLGDSRLNGSICQGKMNDYKMIRRGPSYSKLRSIDTYLMHQASLKWLRASLESAPTKKNIVVTHHAPSIKSISEEFKNDVLSSAYASNLEPLILEYQPHYWIHGHIHHPIKYHVGDTIVLCNPHGYMDEPYNGFDKNLFIEFKCLSGMNSDFQHVVKIGLSIHGLGIVLTVIVHMIFGWDYPHGPPTSAIPPFLTFVVGGLGLFFTALITMAEKPQEGKREWIVHKSVTVIILIFIAWMRQMTIG